MMPHIYVSPAKVLEVADDGRPRVLTLGGKCETTMADWAIPFHYEPARGDLLQVIGGDGRYWVTGVVQGRGHSKLAFRSDTTLRAEGALRLGGDGGLRVDAPEVRIETALFETETETTTERIDNLDSTVRGRLEERAGECTRIIDEEDEQTAARHETVARHVVKIDGGLLRLS